MQVSWQFGARAFPGVCSAAWLSPFICLPVICHSTLGGLSYCDGATLAGTARIFWSARQSRAKAKAKILCYLLSETHTKTRRHTTRACTKLPISWHSKGQALPLLGYAPLPRVYPLSLTCSQFVPRSQFAPTTIMFICWHHQAMT